MSMPSFDPRLRTCADAPAAGFTLRAGPAIAVLGVAFTVWLLSTRSFAQAWVLGVLIAAGVLVRLAMGRAPRAAGIPAS